MKVLRILKVVALVVAIIALLISAAGNYFILKDACKDDVTADSIRADLEKSKFEFGGLFKGKAEEGGVPSDDGDEPGDEDDFGFGDSDEAETESDIESTDSDAGEDAEAKEPGKHIGLVNEIMKLSTKRISLDCLKDLKFDLCDFGEVAMRGEECVSEEGEACVKRTFEVNLMMFVAIIALTVAFILHLISKKCRKTVWGLLVMLFGFALLLACFAMGQIAANMEVNKLLATEITDFTEYRIYVVAFFSCLALLLGFGYIRCGSRAMKRRKKKNGMRR